MPRDRNGEDVARAERDARAVALKASGASYRQIAAKLGIATSTAYDAVQAGLTAVRAEPSEALIRLETEHLDQLRHRTVAFLQARNARVVLGAVGQLVRISERRAKLLGLDAPARLNASLSLRDVSVSDLDEELAHLHAELAALDPPDPPAAPAPTPAPVDVGALVADVLDLALDAAHVTQQRRTAAYQAAAARLEGVDQP